MDGWAPWSIFDYFFFLFFFFIYSLEGCVSDENMREGKFFRLAKGSEEKLVTRYITGNVKSR